MDEGQIILDFKDRSLGMLTNSWLIQIGICECSASRLNIICKQSHLSRNNLKTSLLKLYLNSLSKLRALERNEVDKKVDCADG